MQLIVVREKLSAWNNKRGEHQTILHTCTLYKLIVHAIQRVERQRDKIVTLS
jgi:hypothetical protein